MAHPLPPPRSGCSQAHRPRSSQLAKLRGDRGKWTAKEPSRDDRDLEWDEKGTVIYPSDIPSLEFDDCIVVFIKLTLYLHSFQPSSKCNFEWFALV
ncbi:hypothetical protein AVEN_145630-1 [Araneus ventricosus]|uniref:Uncharacterized protein n=1 Tax=Araneus ventricosus TaxID=182803 RepID=A0A4Y2JSX5_ARAVE|nr:hypothetical protein AVEN_145630-1 [Araneus ventricosus]